MKPDCLAETNDPLGHYTREWGCGKILTFTDSDYGSIGPRQPPVQFFADVRPADGF